jgi:hypothetical protein
MKVLATIGCHSRSLRCSYRSCAPVDPQSRYYGLDCRNMHQVRQAVRFPALRFHHLNTAPPPTSSRRWIRCCPRATRKIAYVKALTRGRTGVEIDKELAGEVHHVARCSTASGKWMSRAIDPLKAAAQLWSATHGQSAQDSSAESDRRTILRPM